MVGELRGSARAIGLDYVHSKAKCNRLYHGHQFELRRLPIPKASRPHGADGRPAQFVDVTLTRQWRAIICGRGRSGRSSALPGAASARIFWRLHHCHRRTARPCVRPRCQAMWFGSSPPAAPTHQDSYSHDCNCVSPRDHFGRPIMHSLKRCTWS
jgi:hypothetical protein